MKKIMALLLAVSLALACTPAMAVEKRFESQIMGTRMVLPDTLDVITELKLKDQDGLVIFFTMPQTGNQITVTLQYVPEYLGLRTQDLPKEEIEGWKQFFTAGYPKHSKSMLIRPNYRSTQRIYRYYGMDDQGTWMLNYSGVQDGLYVSVCCEAGRFGYRRNVMQTVFDVFNSCFQMFALSRGVTFVPFDPEDYEVVVFALLYDDSPDSVYWNY